MQSKNTTNWIDEMTDIEMIMLRALRRIESHPFYDEPSTDNPRYHSSVCRLNDCIEEAGKALKEVKELMK